MKRLILLLLTLALDACGPTHEELIGAAHAPVTYDPEVNHDERYLLVAALPNGSPLVLPPGGELLGTLSFGLGIHQAVIHSDEPPEALFTFYREAYPAYTMIESTNPDSLYLCNGPEEIIVAGFGAPTYRVSYAPEGYQCRENPGHNPRLGSATERVIMQSLTPSLGVGDSDLRMGRNEDGLMAASRIRVVERDGRSLDALITEYEQRIADKGWQPVDLIVTPPTAWGQWQQTHDEIGPVQLELVITIQTEEQTVIQVTTTEISE